MCNWKNEQFRIPHLLRTGNRPAWDRGNILPPRVARLRLEARNEARRIHRGRFWNMNFIFCNLKNPQKTWISFFFKLKNPQKTLVSFFASLKNTDHVCKVYRNFFTVLWKNSFSSKHENLLEYSKLHFFKIPTFFTFPWM